MAYIILLLPYYIVTGSWKCTGHSVMKITETGCADDMMLFVKKNAQSFGDFGKRATFALAIGKPITVV